MKTFKLFVVLFLSSLVFTSCKEEVKKEETKETTVVKAEMLSINISGMSCHIGCAKTIESKLAKKDGVLEATVIFEDSLATIKYNANKIDKAGLMAFVDGIGDGTMYKATEAAQKACTADCKMACCTKVEKKACSKEDCKMACCSEADKKACKEDCKMACCVKAEKTTACTTDCKKECCTA